MTDTPLRILSLDGGSVRGISTLYILKGLMDQISLDQQNQILIYFHFIYLKAGTSMVFEGDGHNAREFRCERLQNRIQRVQLPLSIHL